MHAWNAPARWIAALTPLMLMACGDSATEPDAVDFQVIEELTFAASLGIDLSAMEKTSTGVYIQDLTVGVGEGLVWGDRPTVRFSGWLHDGTNFDSGELNFLMGNNQVVPGFEQGIFGMRFGGIRRMIIPSILAYGDGAVGSVPPGSVLIFEVEVTAIIPAPSG